MVRELQANLQGGLINYFAVLVLVAILRPVITRFSRFKVARRANPITGGAVSVNWVRSQPRWSGMTLFTSPTRFIRLAY